MSLIRQASTLREILLGEACVRGRLCNTPGHWGWKIAKSPLGSLKNLQILPNLGLCLSSEPSVRPPEAARAGNREGTTSSPWGPSWLRQRCLSQARRSPAPDAKTSESVGLQNFGKMLLVFGCIGSDFCKKICVLQHFSKSTRFSTWHFWNLTNFANCATFAIFFAEFSRKLLFF